MIWTELRAPEATEDASSSRGEAAGEARRTRTAEALAAAAALLDGLFEAAPVGLALLDRDLRLVRLNRQLARIAELHDLTPGEPAADVCQDVFSPELLAGARRLLQGDEATPDVEVSLGGGAAERRELVESCYAIRGAAGVVGVGVVVQDVTRRRRQDEFQERVLGIVGHDLRSPLAAARISAQLLARGLTDPRQLRLAEVIRSAAHRMQRIIEDLLDYTQARLGGGIPVRPRSADVSQVCREVLAEALAAEPARSGSLAGEGEPAAELDPDRLGQALSNVVGNAFRYGAPEHAVEVRWRGLPDEVVVEVTNRGAPIPPELVAKVFEPFRRGVHAGREAGLGLGLFIARDIVAGHGGTLEVRSGADETCFTMRLPRRPGAPSPRDAGAGPG